MKRIMLLGALASCVLLWSGGWKQAIAFAAIFTLAVQITYHVTLRACLRKLRDNQRIDRLQKSRKALRDSLAKLKGAKNENV